MRNRLIAILLLLCLLTAAVPMLAQDDFSTVGSVTASNLNVRALPSAAGSSTILAILPRGSAVTIVGRNADTSFYEVVTANGVRGWVASRYIAVGVPGGGRTQPVTSGQADAFLVVAHGIVNVSNLNLRTAPDPRASVVGVVSGGIELDIIGRNADTSWVEVRTPDGMVGWAYLQYLIVRDGFAANAPLQNSDQIATLPDALGNVIAARLNVRAAASPQAAILKIAVSAERVQILGRNADSSWYQVRFEDGVVGWVNSQYIRVGYGTTEFSQDTTQDVADAPVGASVVAPNIYDASYIDGLTNMPRVNVRTGPGPAFASITSIGFMSRVRVLGRNSNTSWIQVEVNGIVGWVYTPYVNENLGSFQLAPVTG